MQIVMMTNTEAEPAIDSPGHISAFFKFFRVNNRYKICWRESVFISKKAHLDYYFHRLAKKNGKK